VALVLLGELGHQPRLAGLLLFFASVVIQIHCDVELVQSRLARGLRLLVLR